MTATRIRTTVPLPATPYSMVGADGTTVHSNVPFTDDEIAHADVVRQRMELFPDSDNRRALEISGGEMISAQWIRSTPDQWGDEPLRAAAALCTAAHLSHCEYPQYDGDYFEEATSHVVRMSEVILRGRSAWKDGDITIMRSPALERDGDERFVTCWSWRNHVWTLVRVDDVEIVAAVRWDDITREFVAV